MASLPGELSDDADRERARATRRAFRRWHLLLIATFLVGTFSIFFRLGTAKSLGSHEGYAIVPAREMLRSGDYVVPRFGGMPRLKKPPLAYWTIAASAHVAGHLDITIARLPSAISGILLAGLMSYWAFRWYGPAGAIGSAAAQLTSVYVIAFARKAEVDMLLVLLITTALAIVATHRVDESRRTVLVRWTGVWACAAVAWLGKFHFGLAMIFAPSVCWLILERRWQMLRGLCNPVGLFVFAAAAGIWPALVLRRLPHAWAIWQEETIGRAFGSLGHQPPWFYLPHLVIWSFPWTIFAASAWPASWRAAFPGAATFLDRSPMPSDSRLTKKLGHRWRELIARGNPRERFLWVWLGVTFAIVTISANKHPHYILPALPAFSLWTAWRFQQFNQRARNGECVVPTGLAVALTVTALALTVVPSFIEVRLPVNMPVHSLHVVSSLAAAGIAAAGWGLFFGKRTVAAFTLLGTWVVASAYEAVEISPALDHRRGAYWFAESIRATYGNDVEIGIYRMGQDAAVWHLGEPVFRAETRAQIAERLRSAARLRLLTTEDRVRDLARVGGVRIVRRFVDQPELPVVELANYRKTVLVEVGPLSASSARVQRQ